ncbi:MAG: hypothetical protein ABIX01_08915 [Chitinophagaceae bacterium]
MKVTTKKITAITSLIWIVAVLINAGLGTYIAYGKIKMDMIALVLNGFGFAILFSLPSFLVFWLLFYFMYNGKLAAANIFVTLLITGIALSMGSYFLFSEYKNLSASLNVPLAGAVLAAAIISISSQFNSIRAVCFLRDHPGHFAKDEKVFLH